MIPFESFPNFTEEMWNGNCPAGHGHERVEGGFLDRWETKYGGGETFGNQIENADFSLSPRVSIFICGDYLQIVDIRYAGKSDIWEYTSDPKINLKWSIASYLYHELEPERIEKYLNTEIPNCKFWNMVQARAKELYERGIRK